MDTSRDALRGHRLSGVVASGLVLVTTVVLVGQLTPGYSPFTETVSRLASPGQPFAAVARIGFVLYGVLVIAGAGPLGDHLPGRERVLGGLIGVFGAAAVTAGIAPKDGPLAGHTAASRIHVVAAIIGGAAILLAMACVAFYAARDTARHTAALFALVTGIAVIVFKLTWGSQLYGFAERILLASPMLWLVTLAVQLSLLESSRGRCKHDEPAARREPVHPSMMRAEMRALEKPSRWPHIAWAALVVGVVGLILLAVGQTRLSQGQCSGIGFGCSLGGADAAGFFAILIVPPAIGILAVGHALIAVAQHLSRHHYVPADGSGLHRRWTR